MVFDSMEQKALGDAESRQAELSDNLGLGVNGRVWLLHSKDRNHPWAVKLFRSIKYPPHPQTTSTVLMRRPQPGL